METKAIDKLYLELSQVTKARTNREIDLSNALAYLVEDIQLFDRDKRITPRTSFDNAIDVMAQYGIGHK